MKLKLFKRKKRGEKDISLEEFEEILAEDVKQFIKARIKGASVVSIPRGFKCAEIYPLVDPWARAVIIQNPDTGETIYVIDEIPLNRNEATIYKKLLDIIYWELKPPPAGENVREYFDREAKKIVWKYQIRLGRTPGVSWAKILYYIERDTVGFGPIDPLMRDPNIEDISCDGVKRRIYVWHRRYENIPTNLKFDREEEIDELVIRLAHKAGKHISVAFPIVDAILPGGHRLAATFRKEVSTSGSTFAIRKFREDPITIVDMLNWRTVSPALAAYLWMLIEHKMTGLIMGVTGSGKTSTLNALLTMLKPTVKVVTIEDTPELRLPLENWVQLVSRPGYGFGVQKIGEITLYDLVKVSLRYRPDIIVVGEIRGEEAYVLFQAMASVSYDTPVLIMDSKGEVSLVNIGEFIDKFYREGEEWIPKPVEGYYVLSHNGYHVFWKPIKYVLRHKANEIYEVMFEGGGKVKATGSHSVFVLDPENLKIIEKPVSMLKPGELLVTFVKNYSSKESTERQLIDVIEIIGNPEKDYVDNVPKEIKELSGGKNPIPLSTYLILERDRRVRRRIKISRLKRSHGLPGLIELDEELAFVFGAYIAYGCVKEHRGKRICFTFGKNEREIAEKVLKIMENKFNIRPVIDSRDTYTIYEYSHTLLAELFEKLLGANLYEKHVPSQLWSSPRRVIKAFFDGLRADSRRTLKRRYTCYTTANERLAYEILWLARIAGYYSELVVEKGTGKNKGKNYYNVLVYLDTNYRKTNAHERIPVKLLEKLIELTKPKSMPLELTYITKRKYVSKKTALKVLQWIKRKGCLTPQSVEYLKKLGQLMNGELAFIEVKDVRKKPYQGYVYDISVPGTESFFGGNIPLLLHNTGHGGVTTIHAESIDAAVKRLTSPPMNIPPNYIPLVHFALLIRRVQMTRPDGTYYIARKITNVWEVKDYRVYHEVAKWNPSKDEFTVRIDESDKLNEIAEALGKDRSWIFDEITRRVVVLRWMMKKGIRYYKDIAKIVHKYYAKPNRTYEEALRELGISKVEAEELES